MFMLENDRHFAVTQHHDMVLADGRVVEAQDVKVGDLFVSIDGFTEEILEISIRPLSAEKLD